MFLNKSINFWFVFTTIVNCAFKGFREIDVQMEKNIKRFKAMFVLLLFWCKSCNCTRDHPAVGCLKYSHTYSLAFSKIKRNKKKRVFFLLTSFCLFVCFLCVFCLCFKYSSSFCYLKLCKFCSCFLPNVWLYYYYFYYYILISIIIRMRWGWVLAPEFMCGNWRCIRSSRWNHMSLTETKGFLRAASCKFVSFICFFASY